MSELPADEPGPDAVGRGRPGPRWVVWLVRGLLLGGIGWAMLVVSDLVTNWNTEISTTLGDGQTQVLRRWNGGQIAWSVAAMIAGLGLVWALVSSLRQRLRVASWMPVTCLFLVLAMATLVATRFVAG